MGLFERLKTKSINQYSEKDLTAKFIELDLTGVSASYLCGDLQILIYEVDLTHLDFNQRCFTRVNGVDSIGLCFKTNELRKYPIINQLMMHNFAIMRIWK